MKEVIRIAIVLCLVLLGCTDKKESEPSATEVETLAKETTSLEGMWKLQSGIWDNEDGTFMRYPEDSLTEGPAYIIYSKTHYMLIAHAPKMDYYRGEFIAYSIDGSKITLTTKLSNHKGHVGMEAVWDFKIEDDILTAQHGKNKEVWKRVE